MVVMCFFFRWDWDEDSVADNVVFRNGGGSSDYWHTFHDAWQVQAHDAREQLFWGQNAGDRMHYILHTCDSGPFHSLVWMREKGEIYKQLEKNAGEAQQNEL